jgi:hypothetical protein
MGGGMESGGNRWWENYLVRYLMPSIAGMVIVLWLTSGTALREALLLPRTGSETKLDASTLVLSFLYGNVFCYIASYPVLTFHATRVLDFRDPSGRPSLFIPLPYALTGVLALFAVLYARVVSQYNYCVILGVVSAFALYQLIRIFRVMSDYKVYASWAKKRTGVPASSAYAFIRDLATERGVIEKSRELTIKESDERNGADDEGDDVPSETKVKTWRYQKEVAETYRHMREHGNSAFIFLLELTLASLCYLVIHANRGDAQVMLPMIGILLATWSVPAVLVHFLGAACRAKVFAPSET